MAGAGAVRWMRRLLNPHRRVWRYPCCGGRPSNALGRSRHSPRHPSCSRECLRRGGPYSLGMWAGCPTATHTDSTIKAPCDYTCWRRQWRGRMRSGFNPGPLHCASTARAWPAQMPCVGTEQTPVSALGPHPAPPHHPLLPPPHHPTPASTAPPGRAPGLCPTVRVQRLARRSLRLTATLQACAPRAAGETVKTAPPHWLPPHFKLDRVSARRAGASCYSVRPPSTLSSL